MGMQGIQQPIIVRVAGLVVRDGRLLLGLEDTSDGEQWSLPGGITEATEEPHEAVSRCVPRDTGIHVSVNPHTPFWTNEPRDIPHYLTLFYWCEYFGGEPRASERKFHAVEWVPIPELRERPLFGPINTFQQKFPNVLLAPRPRD